MIKQIINKLNNTTNFSMTCFLEEAILWSDMYERLDIPSYSFKELQDFDISISDIKEKSNFDSYFNDLKLTIIEFLIKDYFDLRNSHSYDFEVEELFEGWLKHGGLHEYFLAVYPHLNPLNYKINEGFGATEKSNHLKKMLIGKLHTYS